MEILDEQLLIGTDPEFYFVNQQGLSVSANRIISSNTTVRGAGNYGLDGNSATAELRPAPSADPKIVVNNIKKLLNQLYNDIPESHRLKWYAGNGGENNPTGGHLHSCYPNRELLRRKGVTLNNDRSGIMGTICNYLGTYVAVPLILGTEFDNYKRRINNGYGSLSFQENGRLWNFAEAHNGWEYRAVPSHIISPALCFATLSLFKVVLLECVNFEGKISRTILYNFINGKGLSNRENAMGNYNYIKDEIQSMYYYSKYHNAISYLFNVIESGKKDNEARDMKVTWGLTEKSEVEIPNRKQWTQTELFNLIEAE